MHHCLVCNMQDVSQDELAQYRQVHGMSRVEQVLQDSATNLPHPSHGGSSGYPISEHLQMLQMYELDLPVPTSMLRSLRRWSQHVIPSSSEVLSDNKIVTLTKDSHLIRRA